MLTGPFSEHTAQGMDRLSEVPLLHDDMRPQRLDERLLVDELPRPFHQVDQCFDNAPGDVHLLSVGTRHQHAPQSVELEIAEFVDQVCRLRLHAVTLRSFENA